MVAVSVLPSPAMVWAAGVDLAQRGLYGHYIAISTQRVVVGFAFGAAAGLLLGAVVGLSRLANVLLAPTFGGVRAVPSLAWVPLLILWFGIGEESKIILIAIGAFFPVYTIVGSALRHVDAHLIEAGRAFGLHGRRLFATVQLPAVVPSTVSALRLALAQSWLFLVAAELIASSMGLGFLLLDSGQNGRIDRIFLAILSLAVLGKLTDSLLGLFEKWAITRWA
ncbi:ABC transporter permease [Mycobacterium sp. 852013-51886_SCH5428379]|uniref:ABC transporter permease n=1 Tax=Mycobacterium sp. 852013-51886_SCH5428379 TaxID=1834111 RepID=UPI000AD02D41|nr:ABC transporter permease subunit [Mycobacterium sp. 852013-51886_SCH5428379]